MYSSNSSAIDLYTTRVYGLEHKQFFYNIIVIGEERSSQGHSTTCIKLLFHRLKIQRLDGIFIMVVALGHSSIMSGRDPPSFYCTLLTTLIAISGRQTQCNGGLLPDIILLTLAYVTPLGNPFNTV